MNAGLLTRRRRVNESDTHSIKQLSGTFSLSNISQSKTCWPLKSSPKAQDEGPKQNPTQMFQGLHVFDEIRVDHCLLVLRRLGMVFIRLDLTLS